MIKVNPATSYYTLLAFTRDMAHAAGTPAGVLPADLRGEVRVVVKIRQNSGKIPKEVKLLKEDVFEEFTPTWKRWSDAREFRIRA
ncbi:hypothetical protein EVAR_77752_1 [Eumeta japonica]|uniref:Uncharacterized protein n=1 Tax=Eumeta variegata TaxID=151549 RepID=A0A4C1TAT8_EUMVA|nr:hypothetical protein EVAR_77752_1 [Eumeta japonica]